MGARLLMNEAPVYILLALSAGPVKVEQYNRAERVRVFEEASAGVCPHCFIASRERPLYRGTSLINRPPPEDHH